MYRILIFIAVVILTVPVYSKADRHGDPAALVHRMEICLKSGTCKDREVLDFLKMMDMLDEFGLVIELNGIPEPKPKKGVIKKGCPKKTQN